MKPSRSSLAAASLALATVLTPAAGQAAPAEELLGRAAIHAQRVLGFLLESGNDPNPRGREKLREYRMIPENVSSVMERLGYSCTQATFGVVLGDPDKGPAFFARAGLSQLSWDPADHLRPVSPRGGAQLRTFVLEGRALFLPMVKFGVMVRF